MTRPRTRPDRAALELLVAALRDPAALPALERAAATASAAARALDRARPRALDDHHEARLADCLGAYASAARRALPGDSLPASIAQARVLIESGLPFEAHEVLEPHWRVAEEPVRRVLQGIIQLAAARVHVARGNQGSARVLALAATEKLQAASEPRLGFPVEWALRSAHDLARGPAASGAASD